MSNKDFAADLKTRLENLSHEHLLLLALLLQELEAVQEYERDSQAKGS